MYTKVRYTAKVEYHPVIVLYCTVLYGMVKSIAVRTVKVQYSTVQCKNILYSLYTTLQNDSYDHDSDINGNSD